MWEEVIIKEEKSMAKTVLREVYVCKLCGNVLEVLNPGAASLVCCNKPMECLVANTQEASLEKHVPVVEKTEGGIKVSVGSTLHPMEEKHFIGFIEVLTKNQVLRAELATGQAPEAVFSVAAGEVSEVRAYCNLHGLWKAGS